MSEKEIIENMSNEELNEFVFFIAQTMTKKYDDLLLDIQNLINQLEKDEENINYKIREKVDTYTCTHIDKVRLIAFRVKTKEIRERLEKVINNQLIYKKGDTNE